MTSRSGIGIVAGGIALNLILVFLKTGAGWFGHSEALIADGVESAGDVFASIIVLAGIRYTMRPPDDNHPYGHGKAEPLFTFVVVGFLLTSVSFIVYRSIVNIYTPHQLPAGYTLIVLGITVVAKEIYFRITRRVAERQKSSLIEGDAWHHRSDALTSLAAFVGVSAAIYLGQGYESIDDWAALLACAVIIYNAYRLFRSALGEVMDEHNHDGLVEEIRLIAASVDGVHATEKCFVRKAGHAHYVDLHIEVAPDMSVKQGHAIAHAVQDAIREKLPQVTHVLIHVEPAAETDAGIGD